MLIDDLYAAAARAGLLVSAEVGDQVVMVDFRSPDETVLDGLVLSADYSMRFPASALPDLGAGTEVLIADHRYRVRDIRNIGDGSERRAQLTRL